MNEVDALITAVNKRLKGDVLRYASTLQTFNRVSSGSLAFDLMLGGGWPLNVWNEIVGLESHGKTVMALKTIAANMATDKRYTALWVASEEFNKDWAEALGLDLKRVVLAVTNVMEDAYSIMVEALDAQTVDAIVLDSYPALIASQEFESTMYDQTVALGARLTNKLMRVSPAAQRREPDERDCLCIIINQWRDQVGVTYGDPRTTPGGKGKNFSYFTRVEVTRDDWIKKGDLRVGQIIKARTMKNKTAPPSRVAVTGFYFDECFPFKPGDYDVVSEVWNIALTYDLITRHGAWYHYGERKWNGKDAVLQALREDLDLQREMDGLVRHSVLGTPLPSPNGSRKRRVPRK